jgi:hypothetical protein
MTESTSEFLTKRLLVFLQNPWTRRRVYPGKPWDDAQWEAALWESHSGIRLRTLLEPAFCSYRVRNACPIPTPQVDGLRRPDPIYVRTQIEDYQPHVLLLCGVQARAIATMGFNRPFVTMPHPAYRLLSNRALHEIREQLHFRLE